MKTTSIANAKAHLSSLISEVEDGGPIVITRRGKPVARLVSEPQSSYSWVDLDDWLSQSKQLGLTVSQMRAKDLL